MAMAAGMTQAEMVRFGRHGGQLDAAMRAYPAAPRPWLDLSTGINPAPWTPAADVTFDPAPLPRHDDLARLEAAAARFFAAAPAHVAAVPGSEIALRLLPHLGLPAPIAARVPSYGTHGDVADAQVDAAALNDADRAGTLLLANPNNPDGSWIDPASLRAVARSRDGWLVVDEAFADVMPGEGMAASVADGERIVVLRSFGKFFGLAGVRLGFVIAPPTVIARVRAQLGDWPVSAQAIAWGSAAYADDVWIAATRQHVAKQATALDTVLARHGLVAQGACPLFRLVLHPDAAQVFVRLARAGILTRPFASRADWLRFGLPGDDVALDRLDRALRG